MIEGENKAHDFVVTRTLDMCASMLLEIEICRIMKSRDVFSLDEQHGEIVASLERMVRDGVFDVVKKE